MPLSARASVPLLLLAFAPACEDPRPSERPAPIFPEALPTAPAPLRECRFDPVTLPDAAAKTGSDMCFTAGGPEPWWMRYRTDAEPPPALEDAGPPPSACPSDMVLVEGDYCPDVRHHCLRYLDDGVPGAFLSHHRCAEYEQAPECAAAREHRRFCIDRDEWVAPGSDRPLADQSWTMAKELCESLGKRLCFESEWQFACQGEELRPYPYGFDRKAKLCNHDLTDLEHRGKLRDLRVRPSDRPECLSPFGVRNMVGNVDEWTERDGLQKPWRSSLRGGWWLAGRNNCVAATTGHDEYYFGPQTGVRCCANAL